MTVELLLYGRSHLVVGSLRQTQFSSSQLCHGLHCLLSRWLLCLDWHSPSISSSVLLFFSQVVPPGRWYHLLQTYSWSRLSTCLNPSFAFQHPCDIVLLLLFAWNTLTVSMTVSTTIPLHQDPLGVDVAGLQ